MRAGIGAWSYWDKGHGKQDEVGSTPKVLVAATDYLLGNSIAAHHLTQTAVEVLDRVYWDGVKDQWGHLTAKNRGMILADYVGSNHQDWHAICDVDEQVSRSEEPFQGPKWHRDGVVQMFPFGAE